jgi:hypothetical protein
VMSVAGLLTESSVAPSVQAKQMIWIQLLFTAVGDDVL